MECIALNIALHNRARPTTVAHNINMHWARGKPKFSNAFNETQKQHGSKMVWAEQRYSPFQCTVCGWAMIPHPYITRGANEYKKHIVKCSMNTSQADKLEADCVEWVRMYNAKPGDGKHQWEKLGRFHHCKTCSYYFNNVPRDSTSYHWKSCGTVSAKDNWALAKTHWLATGIRPVDGQVHLVA